MSLQRQHFLLSYLKTLSVGPAGVRTRDLPLSRPTLSQLSYITRRWDPSQQVYTCTTLVKNEKFDNCSPLSQKSDKLFSEMFFICYSTNKGDSKGIQHTAIKSIVPHAFGDHSNCETRGVSLRVTQQPTRTKSYHMEKNGKEKSWSWHWLTSSMAVTLLMLWQRSLQPWRIPSKMRHSTV